VIVRHHRSVRGNVEEAVRYYEEKSPNLGVEFVDEFEGAVKKIATQPTRFSFIAPGKRRLE